MPYSSVAAREEQGNLSFARTASGSELIEVRGTGVLLYNDSPVPAPVPGNLRPSGRGPSFLAGLLAAECTSERQRIVRGVLHTMGFEWLGYIQMTLRNEQLIPVSFCTGFMDRAWAHRYFSRAHYEVDPRLREATRSGLPCVWDVDGLAARAPYDFQQSKVQRFVADLRATGMRCGVMLGLPGRRPRERCFLSLLARTPDSHWIGDGVIGQVLTLGLCIHEFYSHGAGSSERPEPVPETLSPLQQNILVCLGRGLGDKEIAARLDLSLHNVDYHMRQLRKRFAVRNRVQLMQAVHSMESR